MTYMLPSNPTLPHKPKQNNCIKLAYDRNHSMKKRKKEEEKERRKKRETPVVFSGLG
jgi:hypothetical protein